MRFRNLLRSFQASGERQRRRSALVIDLLETRSLLSTTGVVFLLPSGLAAGSPHSHSSTASLFAAMVGSLQAQIETQAPRDDAPQHLTDVVNQLVNQYEADSKQLFARSRPWLNTLLQLQGEATRASINMYKTQLDTGLIKTSYFNEDAFLAIQEMTLSRKVWPVGTPAREFLVLARETQQGLDTLVKNLNTPGPAQLSDAAADAVVHVESYAYQTNTLLGATHNRLITNTVNQAVATLVTHVDAAVGQSDFAAQVQAAEQTFNATLVDPSGLFGAHGAIGRFIKQPPNVPNPLSIDDAATFNHLQYREIQTTAPLVVYRNFSSAANVRGRFLSSQLFATPNQAIRREALDQSWYNTNAATFVADVTIPANYTIYVGTAAPIYQGIFAREHVPSLYPGGATQIVVRNSRDPALVYTNLRATGT